MKQQKKGFFIYDFFKKNRNGQIWIETVIYTSIAFAMIALVLAYAKPKIEEIQDKAIIEQSIGVLEEIDEVISDIGTASGNQRVIELSIKKGSLKINGKTDEIIFELGSRCEYSEPKKDIYIGGIIVRTEKQGELNFVTLTKNYSGEYNLSYQKDPNKDKVLSKSPTPYKLIISNSDGKINININ